MKTPSGSLTTHALDAYRATGVSPGRTARTEVRDSTGRIRPVRYSVYGPAWAPPIVVLGGISADRHLFATAENPSPGWWGGVVGPGLALDPARRRLIGLDYLSGPGGDTAPGTDTQARAVEAVLSQEGIRAATIVGSSYGGMVAIAFASLFPGKTERIVVLAGAHRPHPMATGVRSVQRAVVRLGRETGHEKVALAIARALAMTTYRSAVEFEARFGGAMPPQPRDAGRAPVEEYLTARGEAFAARTDPAHFLSLSASIDTHRVDPSTVTAPTTLVSFDTDTLVPTWLVAEFAARCTGETRHVEISTPYGHDGFLKETEAVSREVRRSLGLPGGAR